MRSLWKFDASIVFQGLFFTVSCFLGPMIWEKGFDPGAIGRFDLAALAQPHLKFLFVCLPQQCQPALWEQHTIAQPVCGKIAR
jgi:hypothetical protein